MVERTPLPEEEGGGSVASPPLETLLIHDGERLIEADDRLTPLTGHTAEHLKETSLLATLFAPVSLPYVERVIAERDRSAHLFFVLRPEGGLLPVEVTTYAGEREGEAVQFTLLRRAIEERPVHSSSSEWERRFRHTLDNVRMIAVQLDPTGSIRYANDYLLELTGWSRAELLGVNWFDRFVREPDRQTVRQVHARIMAGEVEMAAHFDNPILTRAGEERMVSWNNTILLDEQGEIVGSSSLGEDITERLLIADELAASEARWRSLTEGSPDHVVTLATDLTITYVNRPSPGLTCTDLVGRSILSFVTPEQKGLALATLSEVLETGKSARYEARLPLSDGSELIYETHAAPLVEEGEVVGLTLVARDVTQRKEDERSLIEAHRHLEEAIAEKDQYLSLIAHDIKSPLTGVRSMLQVVRKDPDRLRSAERDVGGAMVANIDKVLRLIDHMLAGRGSQGITAANRKVVVMRRLVDEVIRSLAVAAEEKNVVVENRVDESIRRFVDPNLTSQLFMNLISNALKFSHGGGVVTVTATDDGEGFIVTDQGVGIEPERIETLTDPSVKSSTVGTGEERGYGLGLPFCEKIARLHGGELAIASTPGSGTSVTARLPDKRPVALIVDDDELIRIVYSARLREMGLMSHEAADGVSAMNYMEREKPDLILCDIHMSPGDGFETLQWVRGRWDQGEMPFFMVSSDSRPDTRERCLQMGANGLLVKPLSDEALAREVKNHLFV